MLVRILNWRHDVSTKTWVPLGKILMGRNLAGAPWLPMVDNGLSDWTSPLTQATFTVWDRLNIQGAYATWTSSLIPLEGFPWFPPGEDVHFFLSWEANGDMSCTKFAPEGKLFLRSHYGDFPMSSWRHILVDFLSKLQPPLRPQGTLSPFESWCVRSLESRHLLSYVYKLVLEAYAQTAPYFIKEWERELGTEFSPTQIQKIMHLAHVSSISTRIQESSFKCLTRWYH